MEVSTEIDEDANGAKEKLEEHQKKAEKKCNASAYVQVPTHPTWPNRPAVARLLTPGLALVAPYST